MNTTVQWNDLTLSVSAEAQIHVEESIPGKTCISLTRDPQAHIPHLTIRWSMPLVDIQYEWYPSCGMNRSLHVDWYAPVKSRISSSAPVYCFYNTEGRNRLTVALSDVLTEIDCNLGVREEDGTLLCCVDIPLTEETYQVTLYRSEDNVSFSEAIRRVARWWETLYPPMNVPEAAQLPMYSAWYSFHQATIAGEIEAECARAAALGMKTVIVDDGWQTSDGNRGYGYCGDWRPTPEKIPDMKAHVARIHALGMKYMLWYSVPFIGEWSQKWNDYKEMILVYHERHHAGVLDVRYPQARRYLIDTYLSALKDWDLDGFKLDFIDSFCPTTQAPPVNGRMDYASVEEAVLRLMTDVMNALRAVKPDILIEFRQSYIGPAMRTFGNMFRVGDCPADGLSNRVGMVDLRLTSGRTAVHSDMLMWHKQDDVYNAARQILSVIFAVPQISVRLDQLPPLHLDMLRFWLSFMAEHRGLLAAPIEAESPQNLYPIVRTRTDTEEAIAVYDRHVALLSGAQTTYVFNATADGWLAVKSACECEAQTFDCLGRPFRTQKIAAGLSELVVPVGGYARISV